MDPNTPTPENSHPSITVILTGMAAQAHDGASCDQILSAAVIAMDAWPSPPSGDKAPRPGAHTA